MRKCKSCGEVKDLSYFALASRVKGVEYKRHLCIPCYSESKLPRKQRIKEEYIEWKKTLRCERCGYDDYRALQFHHEGDKEHNIADMVKRGHNLDKIQQEAVKCIVLCANCHQIEHYHGA
jgi:hypothetical protein